MFIASESPTSKHKNTHTKKKKKKKQPHKHTLNKKSYHIRQQLVLIGSLLNPEMYPGASPASRDRGAKLKSVGQRFSPKCEGLAEITNFPIKSRWSPKKRSSPKSEGFFWPKSQILTFFPPKNTNFFLPKKYRGGSRKKSGGGGGGGAKTKIEGALPSLPPRWQRAWMYHPHTLCYSSCESTSIIKDIRNLSRSDPRISRVYCKHCDHSSQTKQQLELANLFEPLVLSKLIIYVVDLNIDPVVSIGVTRGGPRGSGPPNWNTANDKKLWQHSLVTFSGSYARRGTPRALN